MPKAVVVPLVASLLQAYFGARQSPMNSLASHNECETERTRQVPSANKAMETGATASRTRQRRLILKRHAPRRVSEGILGPDRRGGDVRWMVQRVAEAHPWLGLLCELDSPLRRSPGRVFPISRGLQWLVVHIRVRRVRNRVLRTPRCESVGVRGRETRLQPEGNIVRGGRCVLGRARGD